MNLWARIRPLLFPRRVQVDTETALAVRSAAADAVRFLGARNAPRSVRELRHEDEPTIEQVAAAWMEATAELRRQRSAHFRAEVNRLERLS